jgi:hypothetical protein
MPSCVPELARNSSSAAMRALLSSAMAFKSAPSPAARAAASASICPCSPLTSTGGGTGMQRILLPLGSEAWIAWPSGQPFRL